MTAIAAGAALRRDEGELKALDDEAPLDVRLVPHAVDRVLGLVDNGLQAGAVDEEALRAIRPSDADNADRLRAAREEPGCMDEANHDCRRNEYAVLSETTIWMSVIEGSGVALAEGFTGDPPCAELMILAKCPRCNKAGLVRSERVITAGSSKTVYYCAGCSYTWEEREPPPSPPKGSRPSKR